MATSGKKVCFMTGAAGKLGEKIALTIAEQGYQVFFTWNHSEKKATEILEKIRRTSPESEMVHCDIARIPDIESAFLKFGNLFDRLDLLVAGASNFYRTPLLEITETEWSNLVDTNLKGTFFTMQSSARIMLKQSFISRIITITDISAALTWCNYAPYTISKSGIQHLTRIFAKECAPKILVNSVAPGTISAYPDQDEEPESNLIDKIPLQRFGDPSEIVSAICFLMKSEYITGQVINVDGGRLIY
jgi:3-oxoacyl-[acyl-carrier protein] reductase